MGNILLIGVALSSLLGGGALGTMLVGQNTDMMHGEYQMMDPNEWMHIDDYEDSQRHLENHCMYGSYEDCEWMHRYYDGEDTEGYNTTSEDTMTKSLFQRFLERFPRAFPILRNLLG